MGVLSATAGRKLYLDANLFIYALEAVEPYFTMTVEVLAAIDCGETTAVTSDLTLAECLVKPLQLNRPEVVEAYRGILESRPFFTMASLSREILWDAARLRATAGLKLPDAIHVATAVQHSCEVFLTNDQRLRAVDSLEKLLLRDFLDGD